MFLSTNQFTTEFFKKNDDIVKRLLHYKNKLIKKMLNCKQ